LRGQKFPKSSNVDDGLLKTQILFGQSQLLALSKYQSPTYQSSTSVLHDLAVNHLSLLLEENMFEAMRHIRATRDFVMIQGPLWEDMFKRDGNFASPKLRSRPTMAPESVSIEDDATAKARETVVLAKRTTKWSKNYPELMERARNVLPVESGGGATTALYGPSVRGRKGAPKKPRGISDSCSLSTGSVSSKRARLEHEEVMLTPAEYDDLVNYAGGFGGDNDE
jgi:hypothetical protein